MALHIDSVATCGRPLLCKSEFAAQLQQGDIVACWGSALISRIIEKCAAGPSHILRVWKPFPVAPWLTLEATFPCDTQSKAGVHVGLFADYLAHYPGDMVLLRRPALTTQDIQTELAAGLALLDDNYNWQTEVSTVAHKLLPFLPLIQEKNELYCSGLLQVMAMHTIPFRAYPPDPNTPEQDLIDPSVIAICGTLRGAN